MTNDLHYITLMQGQDEYGDHLWFYLAIPAENYDNYKLAVGLGNDIDPEEFGHILLSGAGQTPPASVRADMIARFELSDDFENSLQSIRNLLTTE